MKLADIDRVNHLVGELENVKNLIKTAEGSDAANFQLFIEAGGDASLKMSEQGASSTHYRGLDVSASFLESLKKLAITELHDKRGQIIAELAALGVDAND